MRMDTRGFTLSELLMTTLVLMMLFAGVMATFIRGMQLNEVSAHRATALKAAHNQLSTIELAPFNTIFNAYHNSPFTVPSLNGMGVSYVDNSQADILTVTVTLSWQEANGRMMGEDSNLNGVLDLGEDVNGNGLLDSPALMSTTVYNL